MKAESSNSSKNLHYNITLYIAYPKM